MAWQQLRIMIPSIQVAEFEEELMVLGALSITLEDAKDVPVFEPALGEEPLWPETSLVALFTLDDDVRKVAAYLQNLYPKQTLSVKIDVIQDEDWERAWLKYFKPLQFGSRLWIIPTGYDIIDPQAVNLHLDPGLAFGTGTHPTTGLCLAWLSDHIRTGDTLIDYGCGSGILAIAGLKLGASHAWAIDYDPQALTATHDNANRNKVDSSQLSLGQNQDLPADYQADVLVANILANPLINLAPILTQHVKIGGKLILSGLLADQADMVLNAYQGSFTFEPIVQSEDWIRIAGTRI